MKVLEKTREVLLNNEILGWKDSRRGFWTLKARDDGYVWTHGKPSVAGGIVQVSDVWQVNPKVTHYANREYQTRDAVPKTSNFPV